MRGDEDGGDAYDRFMARGFDVPPDVVKPKANQAVAIMVVLLIVAVLLLLGRAVVDILWVYGRFFGWW